MSDATDKKLVPMPKEVIAKFEALPEAKHKQDPSELPQWVKLALVRRAVEDLSYKEAAALFNKRGETLRKYAQSPAAHKWLEPVFDLIKDPVAMARALLAGNALHVTIDRMMFLESAKATGDYVAGDKIARDLQDRMGLVAKKANENQGMSIKINFGGAGFDAPVIEAEWEASEDE
jgi:hypothetical protein